MTNSELENAISETFKRVVTTGHSNAIYPFMVRHFDMLLKIQERRAAVVELSLSAVWDASK